MDRPGLQACERVELFFAGAERRERLGRPSGEDAAGVCELAAAAAALDEPLSGGELEEAQVLADAGLSDADRCRGRGEGALALDLDEQPHPGRVPEC